MALDKVRVVLAGLFVLGTLYFIATYSAPLFVDATRSEVIMYGAGLAILICALCALAYILFNASLRKPPPDLLQKEPEEALERPVKLVTTKYNAVRLFELEPEEDEGRYYFIELLDGSVLYLHGVYLEEYAAADGADSEQAVFPSTLFAVQRSVDGHHVASMTCAGSALVPEKIFPRSCYEAYRQGRLPKDGDIITDQTYVQIKNRMVEHSASPP